LKVKTVNFVCFIPLAEVLGLLEVLATCRFKPDMLFQQECLEPHSVENTEPACLLKVFWAIDIHHTARCLPCPMAWTPEHFFSLP
jgi:hypothetical protein